MLNIQCIFANTEYIYLTTSMSPCQFLESFHVSHASGHMYTCTLSIVHVAVPPGIFAEDGCLWMALWHMPLMSYAIMDQLSLFSYATVINYIFNRISFKKCGLCLGCVKEVSDSETNFFVANTSMMCLKHVRDVLAT